MTWKQRVDALKRDTYALYLASRDPRVHWLPKLIIAAAVAYALSPLDLIPDFIPIIGYLDDLILLPLAVWLATRLVPDEVWKACQQEAARQMLRLPRNRRAAVVIILLWLLVAAALGVWLLPILREI